MADPVIVLKFGSSVLRTADDLPLAVLEIYREVRRGRRVVAVVSAFAGVTDALLDDVRRRHDEPEPHAVARVLETGENASAAALGLLLEEAGVPAEVVDAAGIGLTAEGPPLEATPTRLIRRRLQELLGEAPVVVVPGFSGRDRRRRPVLLGRGGSDLTALFLAKRLGAVECRLLKDIDGLLRVLPDGALDYGTRYGEAHYRDCLRDGGPLVQPRAVAFAQRHGLDFTIARAGSSGGTRAGSFATRLEPMPASRPVRVALAGLGTVGLGVYRWLCRLGAEVTVTGVLVRDPVKKRPHAVPPDLLVPSEQDLLRDDPELVVEAIGGCDTAGRLVRSSLKRGLSVVTANKMLVADDPKLLDAVLGRDRLACSAAVGGAVPMIERVRSAVDHEPAVVLRGVLNGTCNAVLDLVADGLSAPAAVAEAQRRGLAESDPTADLSGRDAAAKLAILAAEAFGIRLHPEDIPCEAVGPDIGEMVERSRSEDRVLRQVAYAERRGKRITASVRLCELEPDDPLAGCMREENTLQIVRASGESLLTRGKGAGRLPTTVSVVSDVLEQIRDLRSRAAVEARLVPG